MLKDLFSDDTRSKNNQPEIYLSVLSIMELNVIIYFVYLNLTERGLDYHLMTSNGRALTCPKGPTFVN
jgi:hypothetical protein